MSQPLRISASIFLYLGCCFESDVVDTVVGEAVVAVDVVITVVGEAVVLNLMLLILSLVMLLLQLMLLVLSLVRLFLLQLMLLILLLLFSLLLMSRSSNLILAFRRKTFLDGIIYSIIPFFEKQCDQIGLFSKGAGDKIVFQK